MRTKRSVTAIGAVLICVLSLVLGPVQAGADTINAQVCTYNKDGRRECFWVGTATGYSVPGAVYHRYEITPGGPMTAPVSLGGWATSGIAVTKNQDGRIEIFVRAAGGDLAHRWQVTPGGAWGNRWYSMGGHIAYGPGLHGPFLDFGEGRILVRVWGPDNMWHAKWQMAPNCCWTPEWQHLS
jgi:hypothetical protein